MGRNKQVLCYICNKQMRKDNMAQHLRTHNKKLERYVYSGERDNVKTCYDSYKGETILSVKRNGLILSAIKKN